MNASLPNARMEALHRLYHRYAPLVRAVARTRGVPEAALDDVVHDAFLVVHRRLDERDPAVSLRAWIVGIARNVAFSHRRAASRRVRRHEHGGRPGERVDAFEDTLDAQRAWSRVSAFLGELEPGQREAFVLCQVYGLSAPEVATAVQCSVNTIYSRLRLARRRFEQRFPDEHALARGEALLGQARREAEPSESVRARGWVLLAAQIGSVPAAVPTAIGLRSIARVATSVVMVAAIGAGGAYAARTQREPVTIVATTVPDPAARMHTPIPQNGPQAQQRHAAALVDPTPTPFVAEHGRAPAITIPEGPTPKRARQAPDRSTHEERPPTRNDALQRELALLAAAQRELSSGRPEAALVWIARHAHEHSAGVLTTERLRLEVEALCRTGRIDAAATVARTLDRPLDGRSTTDPCRSASER